MACQAHNQTKPHEDALDSNLTYLQANLPPPQFSGATYASNFARAALQS
jgi:hypothetical protein